jgi:hypothetical protein
MTSFHHASIWPVIFEILDLSERRFFMATDRRKLTRREARRNLITVALKAREFQALETACEEEDISRSSYVRRLILQHLRERQEWQKAAPTMDKSTVYCTGACQPNPGGLAVWAWVAIVGDQEISQNSGCLGCGSNMTNQIAEYMAVVQALRSAKRTGISIDCRTDSQLVVKQGMQNGK